MEGKEKKSVKIPLAVFIIMILVIIALVGVVVWKFVGTTNKEENDNTTSKTSKNESNIVENNMEEDENKVNDTDEDDEKEELSLNNKIVKELREKIDFNYYSAASIYTSGDFTVEDIDNDMILRLAWSKLSEDDMELIEGNQGMEKHVKKESLKKIIENLFGDNIEYTDESFTPVNVKEFYSYQDTEEVEYSNNEYVGGYYQGGGGTLPFIYQEISNAKKSDDTVELYVKVAFVDTEYIDGSDNADFNFTFYQDYKNKKFVNEIIKMKESEYINGCDDDYEYSYFDSNSMIKDYLDEFNTYKYTFNIEDGEYYLYSVEKVEE